MLEKLKQEVFEANIFLKEQGLVCLTWGNASAFCKEKGLVVIKPSGVAYEQMKAEDMVVLDLQGNIVEGELLPSSDAPTHLELYRRFPEISGIVHTHSRWATIYSQCCKPISPFGTTHADTFYGDIPCTRLLTDEEINGEYELNTGKVIAETFTDVNPLDVPAVLVASHGPFTWGKTVKEAANNALILEEVSMMAWHTEMLRGKITLQQSLADKHYYRKHGDTAYYGQRKQ